VVAIDHETLVPVFRVLLLNPIENAKRNTIFILVTVQMIYLDFSDAKNMQYEPKATHSRAVATALHSEWHLAWNRLPSH